MFGYQQIRTAKKPWITDKMIEKMDQRRKLKAHSSDEGRKKYSSLNNELRRETNRAREVWWEQKCEELHEYDKRGRSDLMYQVVRRLTRTGKIATRSSAAINDENGVIVTEIGEVKRR